MPRSKHPKREVEDALHEAELAGWAVKEGKGHAWGILYCPYGSTPTCRCGTFCKTSVWSTPQSPANHAKDLLRVVRNCAERKAEAAAAEGSGEGNE